MSGSETVLAVGYGVSVAGIFGLVGVLTFALGRRARSANASAEEAFAPTLERTRAMTAGRPTPDWATRDRQDVGRHRRFDNSAPDPAVAAVDEVFTQVFTAPLPEVPEVDSGPVVGTAHVDQDLFATRDAIDAVLRGQVPPCEPDLDDTGYLSRVVVQP